MSNRASPAASGVLSDGMPGASSETPTEPLWLDADEPFPPAQLGEPFPQAELTMLHAAIETLGEASDNVAVALRETLVSLGEATFALPAAQPVDQRRAIFALLMARAANQKAQGAALLKVHDAQHKAIVALGDEGPALDLASLARLDARAANYREHNAALDKVRVAHRNATVALDEEVAAAPLAQDHASYAWLAARAANHCEHNAALRAMQDAQREAQVALMEEFRNYANVAQSVARRHTTFAPFGLSAQLREAQQSMTLAHAALLAQIAMPSEHVTAELPALH
jgi:hypothetical protein